MGMPLKETVATASEKKNITIGGWPKPRPRKPHRPALKLPSSSTTQKRLLSKILNLKKFGMSSMDLYIFMETASYVWGIFLWGFGFGIFRVFGWVLM